MFSMIGKVDCQYKIDVSDNINCIFTI